MDSKPVEYVVGLLMDPAKQKVVLIKKRRPMWQRDRWNGPGGHVNQGETPAAAVSREFEEEAGVRVPLTEWVPLATLLTPADRGRDRDTGAIIHFFFASSEAFWKVQTQTDEIVQGFHVRELPHDLLPNLRWLIPMAAFDRRDNMPYLIHERTLHPRNAE